jgi:UDP-N-acetylglucosamine acyltransferase
VGHVEAHATAVVSPHARIGTDVRIGPYCVVGEDAELDDEVELLSHVVISGRTRIGAGTRIFPFASIGHRPQDLKYEGEPSRLVIGKRCVIRESVTINPGTRGGGMLTSIGNDCLLMANSHVAHDCRIGDSVVIASFVALAGHCQIDDFVAFGGMCGVHQFVRIGAHAFIGAHSMIDADVIPYGMAVGNRARLAGLNLVGLKRRGFERDSIHTLRTAYRMLFSNEGTLRERIEDAASMFQAEPLVQEVVSFIAASADRPLCLPRHAAVEA